MLEAPLRRGAGLRGRRPTIGTGTVPREKQRHWCRRRMKSRASSDERQNRNHTRWRCVHAQDWCNVPERNDQPRERHTPPPSVSPVPLLCVLCLALSCSLSAVLSSPQQRTMSSVPNRLKPDEIKKRGFADGFRGNENSVLEFRTVQSALTERFQPRPSTDMVMLPSKQVRTTPTAVGPPVPQDTCVSRMNHNSLKQQPLHGHTQGPV